MDEIDIKLNNPNILITGGSGFLGQRIVEEFLLDDSPIKPGLVKVFDIKPYVGEFDDKIEYIKGDVRDTDAVNKACEGIDIVIHAAAIIDWGTKSEKEVLSINVDGTKNIIEACKTNGVKYLVYTSSLDAVFTGKPLINIDESQEYPEKHQTIYCESKHLSEVEVMNVNSDQLKTCVLRPSDIYGEADPYHIDALIEMAMSGFYVRLGNGKSKCQHVYVGNMAYAHVLAASEMWNGNKNLFGEIFFITDGEGENFFKFFDQVVAGAGYKIFPKNLWLPKGLAYTIGSISELIAVLMRPIKRYNPKFSRFAVIYTCTDFTFSAKKAEKSFGYKPKYNLDQSLEKTIGFYRKKKML
ncbi:MAG TPA: NAD-dependent epimerase/dehydratase family protein [Bacteroidetes bacterium]|nr:NAD-dependent epimerase/dehydratase family protein [Bacteroidota bacterium]